ncbi:MAG: hypothetical protein VR69_01915 [Peptococcaceae bacterium BRH_c4b]|nr:MAG: hypothetical protein VR69_01915 [Peptococcaceae bacterium BRH_c4b]
MLYLYGIIDTPGPLNFTCAGRDVFTVACVNIGALVSPGSGAMARVDDNNVLAHGEVLKNIAARHVLLPVKFGTLLAGQSDVEGLLTRNYRLFESSLQEVRGAVEMTVKALWDAGREREKCSRKVLSACRGDDSPDRPGTAFLLQKRKEHLIGQCLKEAAGGPAEEIHGLLARGAEKNIKRVLPTPGIFYHGSFMIKKENAGDFGQNFLAVREKYAGYKFLLTGPWPLYSFVSIKCS